MRVSAKAPFTVNAKKPTPRPPRRDRAQRAQVLAWRARTPLQRSDMDARSWRRA